MMHTNYESIKVLHYKKIIITQVHVAIIANQ